MSVNTAATIATFAAIATMDVLNEELVARGLPEQTDPSVAASLLAAGVRSQGDFASVAINLMKGDIEASDMKEMLTVAFPDAKIGDRHGGHYLCHARTGGLKNCRFKPMTANARKKRAKAEKGEAVVDVKDLTAGQLEKAAEWKAAEEAKAAEEKAAKAEPKKAEPKTKAKPKK